MTLRPSPTCPECGSPLVRFRRPSASDPDDPETGAYCTDPDCPYAY